jgi:SnoaL-like domain
MLPSELFPGESTVPSERSAEVVREYYEQFPNVDRLIDDDATALMPGDPRRLRWSGRWRDRREFAQMCTAFSSTLQVEKRVVAQVLANNGSVAVTVRLRGRSTASQASFDFEGVEFFQISGEKENFTLHLIL